MFNATVLQARTQGPLTTWVTRAEVIRYRAEVADRMSISGVQDKVSLRYWSCDACGSWGRISNWEQTVFDRRLDR